MVISATEFKQNLGKYLEMVSEENILITKNGKLIAQISQPRNEKMDILSSLVGFAKSDDIDLDKIRSERLLNK